MLRVAARPTLVPQLGKILIERGILKPREVEEALSHKRSNGCKLGQSLVALGFLSAPELTEALNIQGRIACLRLHPEIIDVGLAARLGEHFSRENRAIAINRVAGYTTVAMDDPQDVFAIDSIQAKLESRVLPVYASANEIADAIRYVFNERGQGDYDDGRLSVEALVERASDSNGPADDFGMGGGSQSLSFSQEPKQEEEVDLGEGVDEKPIVRLVQSVLIEAFQEGASDIHIEPNSNDCLIRFRVDGACYEKTRVPRSWASRMMVRIKLMAALDIAQRRLPQDGRAQLRVGNDRVDLRVTTTPTICGEGAVIRILDGGRSMKNMRSLGLRDEQISRLQRIIRCREGFVLATGPTGSGKTTTLYSLLKELITPERKIVTLEDPVENVIEGVSQINANPKIGLTFAKGLRSILRQDPDIVLVGEIRDQETARIAVEASMTGHIVLSSLHTVGSVESLSRLMDMGIESYLLGDTLKGVVAQRLLRRICEHCRQQSSPDPEVLRELGIEDPTAKFYEGRGCSRCRNQGYKGRIGIYEILLVNEELRGLIQAGANSEKILSAARQTGLTTLREEGLARATAGDVTLADVLSMTL
ncbi:MAG: ATPase, T2SS/T4P/T4SS family [Planctomycetota bacterium]|nr:ATPase, T2SS/T4P/T4SS family [Planctomycetota bacterium]